MTAIIVLFYILIAYIVQEGVFDEYMRGDEDIPDDEVVQMQLYILLWPISIPLAIMLYSSRFSYE